MERSPPLPDGAGIVVPITEAERTATRLFLHWVAEVVSIADANADRAEAARPGC